MIVFLGGNNDYAIVQHLQKLRKQYVQKYTDALEMVECDLSEMTIPQLEQQLMATPMFFTHRLLIVHALGAGKIDPDILMPVLERTPESTVAVLDGRGLDRRSRLYKRLAALPSAKIYEQLTESQMITWAQREAKGLDAVLSRPVAQYLIQRVGTHTDAQWRLAHELAKLAAGADGGEITKALVDEIVAADPSSSIFDLIAALRRHAPQDALRRYDELMGAGGNEQQILATLQWHFRVLVLVHFGATTGELTACGVKSSAATRAKQEAQQCSDAYLALSYQDLLDADMAIKSGLKKPHQAMTDLVLSLASR